MEYSVEKNKRKFEDEWKCVPERRRKYRKMYTNYNSLNENCIKYLFAKLSRAIFMMEISEKLRGMKRK